MGTLFYSPGIRVLIEAQDRSTGNYQIVDVSDDIANASLTLSQNQPHSFRVTITNNRRKYDGMFTPNDRIIVQLRRVNWLQCFAGYLSDVPLWSVYSRSVQLTAECTLKRLRYHPYDSGTSAFINLMNEFMGNQDADGGMTERIKAVLTRVVGWEEEAIHIGRIPDLWVDTVENLYDTLEPELSRGKELLGSASVNSGTTSGSGMTPQVAQGVAGALANVTQGVAGALANIFGAGTTTAESGATPTSLNFADRSPTPRSGLLRGHVAAAWDFIKANWPQADISSGRRGGSSGDHPTGSAIDIVTPGIGDPAINNESRAILNSICLWFVANPQAFGSTQIIWRWKSNEGNGWHSESWNERGANARSGGDDMEHIHHLHLAFAGPNLGHVGPMGNAWPGATAEGVDPGGPPPSGANPAVSGGGDNGPSQFVNASAWYYQADSRASMTLTGYRVLMNDTPQILPLLGQLCEIGQRSYCSAPNGDFIAWFPDYFGLYGTAGRIVVEPVELMDFTVNWTDSRLKTHEFVVGAAAGYGALSVSTQQAANQFTTHGIASIDFPEIIAALMNITEDDPIWGTPKRILDRFGARPETQPMANTTMFSTREMEFWAAVWKFTYNWATQFSSQIPLTFMPEAFPGMILEIPTYKFQAYIEQVTHTIDFKDGAGFRTDVRIVAPSVTDGSGIAGLVLGKSDPDKRLSIAAVPLGTSQSENLPGQDEPTAGLDPIGNATDIILDALGKSRRTD